MSDHLPVSLMFSMNPPLSTITSKNKTTNVKFMNSTNNLVIDFQQKEDFTLKKSTIWQGKLFTTIDLIIKNK